MAFDPDGKRLFFSADNGAMRDIVEYDITRDESRKVLKDGKIKPAAVAGIDFSSVSDSFFSSSRR